MRITDPFSPSDMRTWPLGYTMADAAAFGLLYTCLTALVADDLLSGCIAAGGAGLIAASLPYVFPAQR